MLKCLGEIICNSSLRNTFFISRFLLGTCRMKIVIICCCRILCQAMTTNMYSGQLYFFVVKNSAEAGKGTIVRVQQTLLCFLFWEMKTTKMPKLDHILLMFTECKIYIIQRILQRSKNIIRFKEKAQHNFPVNKFSFLISKWYGIVIGLLVLIELLFTSISLVIDSRWNKQFSSKLTKLFAIPLSCFVNEFKFFQTHDFKSVFFI